jgi:hypothetical protein
VETEEVKVANMAFELSEPTVQDKPDDKSESVPSVLIGTKSDWLSRPFELAVASINVPNTTQSMAGIYMYGIDSMTNYYTGDWYNSENNVIDQFMASFELVRWKSIRYRVEMDSTPMIYGPLCVVPLRWDARRGVFVPTSQQVYEIMGLMSSPDAIWLNVNEQKFLEFEVHPLMMLDWYTTGYYLNDTDLEHNTSDFWYALPTLLMINPGYLNKVLTSTSGVVRYKVYANFEGLEFASPVTISPEFRKKRQAKQINNFVACSSYDHPMSYLKRVGEAVGYNYCSPGLANFPAEPVNYEDARCAEHDIKYGVIKTYGERNEADAQLRQSLVRPHVDHDNGRTPWQSLIANAMLAQETWTNIMYNPNDQLELSKKGIEPNPGPPKISLPCLEGGGQEEDKPVTINPYQPDFSIGSGQCEDTEHEAVPSDVKLIFGDMSKRHSILELCRTPGIGYIGELSSANTTFMQIIDVRTYAYRMNQNVADLNHIGYTWIGYFAQFFRYYRGGFNCKLVFFGCSTMTARVRLTLMYGDKILEWGAEPLKAFTSADDITIKGTVVVDFKVPYQACVAWAPVYYFINSEASEPVTEYDQRWSPALNMKLTCLDSSGDIPPTLPFVLFVAADETFEWYMPLAQGGEQPPFQACMNIHEDWGRSHFKNFPQFRGNTENRRRRTVAHNVEDFLERWTNLVVFDTTTQIRSEIDWELPLPVQFSGSSPLDFDWMGSLACLFAGVSGPLEFQVSFTKNQYVVRDADANVIGLQEGGGCLGVAHWPIQYNDSSLDPVWDLHYPESGFSMKVLDQWANHKFSVDNNTYLDVMFTDFFKSLLWGTTTSFQRRIVPFAYDIIQPESDLSTPTSTTLRSIMIRTSKKTQFGYVLPIPHFKYWATNTTLIPTQQEFEAERQRLIAKQEKFIANNKPRKVVGTLNRLKNLKYVEKQRVPIPIAPPVEKLEGTHELIGHQKRVMSQTLYHGRRVEPSNTFIHSTPGVQYDQISTNGGKEKDKNK